MRQESKHSRDEYAVVAEISLTFVWWQAKQAEAVQATKESQRLRARLGQAAPATAGSRSGSQVGSRAPSQVQSQAPSQAPSKAPSRAPSHRSNADAADAPAPAPGIKKSSSILGSLFKGKNK